LRSTNRTMSTAQLQLADCVLNLLSDAAIGWEVLLSLMTLRPGRASESRPTANGPWWKSGLDTCCYVTRNAWPGSQNEWLQCSVCTTKWNGNNFNIVVFGSWKSFVELYIIKQVCSRQYKTHTLPYHHWTNQWASMRRFVGHSLSSNREITGHHSSVNFNWGLTGDQLITGVGEMIYR